MKKFHLLLTVYLLSFIVVMAGALVKMLQLYSAEWLLIAGIAISVLFIILVLQEVWRSARLGTAEKLMWTVGMLFFNSITGLVYLLVGRKRIVVEA